MRRRGSALLLFMVLWAASAQAQTPCPAGDINQHQGAWRLRRGAQSPAQFRAPAASYSRATADGTLEKILGWLRAAYPQPSGTMAYFTKDLTFSTPYRDRPFGYSLSVGFAGFWCTQAGTLAELGESGVFINVDVNNVERAGLLMSQQAPSMQALKGEMSFNAAGDADGQYTIDGKRIFLVPPDTGEHRGVEHFVKHEYAGRAEPPDRQWFVVRRPDVPLVIAVTRREYVQQFRGELELYTTRELERRREWTSQSGDANAASHDAAFGQSQAAYRRAVDEYLNPAYMDPKLPRHVPQFIVIQLSARAGRYPWETSTCSRDCSAGSRRSGFQRRDRIDDACPSRR